MHCSTTNTTTSAQRGPGLCLMVLKTILPVLLIATATRTTSNQSTSMYVTAVRNIQVVYPLQSLTIWDRDVIPSSSSSQDDDDNNDNNNASKEGSTTTAAITDHRHTGSMFRSQFVSKFQMGLQAEVEARNTLQQQQQQQQAIKVVDSTLQQQAIGSQRNSKNNSPKGMHWAKQAAQNDQNQHRQQEAYVEAAHDQALLDYELQQQQQQALVSTTSRRPLRHNNNNNNNNKNQFQFVGVIQNQPTSSTRRDNNVVPPPIVWYTRPKPKHAKWTIRLVHVNRAAILKDLFQQKKIDILVQYHNAGLQPFTAPPNTVGNERSKSIIQNTTPPANGVTAPTTTTTMKPNVTGQYRVRERSWKNFWNSSLKHVITDSSGMYWRERRLHSMSTNSHAQYYTDGSNVYIATYRYVPDGRNGMQKVSTLAEFLNSRSIDTKMKDKIVHRLKQDIPDVVLEE
jgi:hypothetical protein